MAAPQVVPIEETRLEADEVPETDRPWVTVVWNDPVNLMSYVTWVLQKLFGYSKEKAERLMLDVHHKGKAIVSSGPGRRWNTTPPGCRPTGSGRRWTSRDDVRP